MEAYPMYQRLSLNEAEAFFYDNDYLLVVGLSGDKDLVINAKDLQAKAASQIASNFVSIQQADDTEIGFLFSLSSDAADDSSSCSSLSQASSTTTLDDSGPGWAKIQTNTILQSLYQHQINGIFLVQLTAKDVFVLIRFPVFSIAAQKAVKDALSPKTKTGSSMFPVTLTNVFAALKAVISGSKDAHLTIKQAMAAHRVIGDLLSSANALPDTTKHKLDDAVCELSTCKNALKAVFTEAEMAVFTERTGVLEEWFRQEQERLSHTLPAIRRTKGDIAKAVLKVMKT